MSSKFTIQGSHNVVTWMSQWNNTNRHTLCILDSNSDFSWLTHFPSWFKETVKGSAWRKFSTRTNIHVKAWWFIIQAMHMSSLDIYINLCQYRKNQGRRFKPSQPSNGVNRMVQVAPMLSSKRACNITSTLNFKAKCWWYALIILQPCDQMEVK